MQAINTPTADKLKAKTRPSHAEIARSAAQLWEKRGRPVTRDEEIWLEAEQILLSGQGDSQPPAARAAEPKSAARDGFSSKRRWKIAGLAGQASTSPAPSVV
ncbi:MAG: DUF2934 domain-containing protein [Limisphaerales bacterium]